MKGIERKEGMERRKADIYLPGPVCVHRPVVQRLPGPVDVSVY
jgi:hypothetical protein